MSNRSVPPEEERVRAVCYRCHKPKTTCVCARIPLVRNRTGICVLQHPRERFHPIGTARFVELGLAESRVEVAWSIRADARPAWLPENAAVLYPSPDAEPLIAADPVPRHLIVLDGTWNHAHTLHRDQRWLRALPHYCLPPAKPSRYRIRREPRAECLSTVEAVCRALCILEPDTAGLDELLSAFDAMIDTQIAARDARRGARRLRAKRPDAWRALPRAFFEDFDHLVVVYGESSLMRFEGDAEREIVQWAALRPATGEVFEKLLRPEASLLRPWHLEHMELTDEDFDDATDRDDLRMAWRDFVRPRDVLAAWNPGTLDLLSRHIEPPGARLVLKSVYSRLRPGGGALDAIALREALAAEPLPIRGRAATRLGNAVALVQHLRDHGLGAIDKSA